MSSQYYKATAYVGTPHRNAVEVTIPLVGPAGPQGPAGEAGAGAVESVNGQTGVVVLAAADVGAASTSHTHGNLTNAGAIGTTSGLPVKTGTSGVLEAGAFGTAAGQFAEGNHTHTPASLGAAPAVTVIELTPSPGSTTITTSQLPARGIAFIEGGGSFTINLPTPDKRQSGLTFSIKVEHEGASGDVFITVVHNASDLLTSYELDEDESSLDFLWDGYRWTYSSANWLYSYPNRRLIIPPLSGTLGLSEPSDSTFRIVGSSDATKKVAFEVDGLSAATTRTLTVPDASGTLALTSDFAAPPAIGNTTPAAITGTTGTFSTLTANTTINANTAGSAVTETAATFTHGRGNNNDVVRLLFRPLGSGSASNANAVIQATGIAGLFAQLDISVNTHTRVRFPLETPNAISIGTTFQSNLGFGDSTMSPDVQLHRAAADTLELRRAANAQTFRIYNTYDNTNANNHERGFLKWSSNVFQIGTEKGSGSPGGTARALEFQTDGVTRMTLGSAGEIGFFGTAAAAQPAAIADATDAATTQARLNDLLAAMRTLGLIDT